VDLSVLGPLDNLPLWLRYRWCPHPRQPLREPAPALLGPVVIRDHPTCHPIEPGQRHVACRHVVDPTPRHRKYGGYGIGRIVVIDSTEAIRMYRAIVLLVELG
jgi:hypothetical protein